MIRWIVLSAALLAFQAQAEIYKCKDAGGKVTYQQMPCASGHVGTVEAPPPVSEENRKRAQENLDGMVEANRQSDIKRGEEWQKKQEELKRAEQEELERRQYEQEREEDYGYWYPWPQGPSYGRHPHVPRQGHKNAGGQRGSGKCVPSHVGDHSCN